MPFPPELDSGQLTAIRGTRYASEQLILLNSNTVVLQAEITAVPTTNSFAQVTLDTPTIGAIEDALPGMRVLIGEDDNPRHAFFDGRVRKTPAGSVLYINETSARIEVGHICTVILDFGLYEKLARVVNKTTYLKDWDLTYSAPKPIIYDLQSAYVGIGDPTTFALSPQAFAVASGATIDDETWLWTVPTGVTITVGAEDEREIEIEVEESLTEYWIHVQVEDIGGRVGERWFPVWALPADLAIPAGFEGAQIERALEGGANASVSAFAGVDDVLDNTLCVIFRREWYEDDLTPVVTNIDFVGRLRNESDPNNPDETANRVWESRFEIEGMGTQLGRVAAAMIECLDKGSASVWDEIVNLTPWRAICHLLQTHTTFCEINSLSFDSTSNTFRYPSFPGKGSSIWDSIVDFMNGINATMDFAASGEAFVYRDGRWLTGVEQDALETVADFEMQDGIQFTFEHSHIDQTGQVNAFGASFNTSANKIPVVAAFWPGSAQGPGVGRPVLDGQILAVNQSKLAAEAEIERRIGKKAAIDNNRDELTVEHPDGYHFLIPTAHGWYTWTLDPEDAVTRGLAFDDTTRWILESVSVTHDNETGSDEVTGKYVKLTPSSDGKAYDPPTSTTTFPAFPPFPPFNIYPSFPDLPILLPPDLPPFAGPPYLGPVGGPVSVPKDGNATLLVTENGAWISVNFVPTTEPDYREITPSGLEGTLRAGKFGIGKEAYLLESDGDISVLWHTPDAFASPVEWTSGEPILGVYDIIRPTTVQGEVYIRGHIIAETGCYPEIEGGVGTNLQDRSLDLGDGWWSVETTDQGGGGATFYAQILFPGCCYLADYNLIGATNAAPGNRLAWNCEPDEDFDHTGDYGVGAGCLERVLFRSFEAGEFQFQLTSDGSCEGGGINAGAVRFSDDSGATWESPFSVTSGGGMDTSKVGDGALIGNAAAVQIATLNDLDFSLYGDPLPTDGVPTAIWWPRMLFSGGSNGSTDTPVYLVASAVLTASDESMWRVTADGLTYTDITPEISGDFFEAVGPECIAMPWSTNRIAAVGMFGDEIHLVTSLSQGTIWADRGALNDTAKAVRFRNGDKTGRQLFICNGAPSYSGNFGADLVEKAHPDPLGPELAPLVALEVYG